MRCLELTCERVLGKYLHWKLSVRCSHGYVIYVSERNLIIAVIQVSLTWDSNYLKYVVTCFDAKPCVSSRSTLSEVIGHVMKYLKIGYWSTLNSPLRIIYGEFYLNDQVIIFIQKSLIKVEYNCEWDSLSYSLWIKIRSLELKCSGPNKFDLFEHARLHKSILKT